MPYVFLEIRPAIRKDFTAIDNSKKLGTPYFCKNKDGIIEKKINYLTENTDMVTFKKKYNNNEIFVMKDTLQACAIETNLE
jgi:hypothetical protein